MGIDRKLVQRRAANINFNDKVGRWVSVEINFSLAADPPFILDVEAGIRLKSLGQILTFEGCRTGTNRVNL